MSTVSAYWWIGKPNFGDLLTPLLLERFGHVPVTWSEPEDAQVAMVGSILEAFPSNWSGIVAGTGKMFEQTKIDLPQADILALRGPLSAKNVKGNYTIGDCALLANELVMVDKTYNLGLIPHWSDTELEHRPEFKRYNPVLIRPSSDPLEVLRQIGRCRKIVSSSLHGVIVADAFGIPRRTELAPKLTREGGTFKFRDHSAAVKIPFKVGVTQEAPRYTVQDLQQNLFDVIEEIGARYA